jgi:lipid II:glycine glycyltransferase (peptidoglycan interpeptide bridge formation enzyme)
MVDIRQSPFWAAFMEELGWDVEKIGPKGKEQLVFLRKVPLIGSLLKSPRLVSPIPYDDFDSLAKERKLAFAKIEPFHRSSEKTLLNELKENSFVFDRWALHPTKTIVLDLRLSEDDLLANMEKDTRYSVRVSQRKGVRVIRSNDLNRFLKLYKQTAKRQKFTIAEKELRVLWDIFSNEGKAFILIAQWNKDDIAACLILHYGKTAYYYHAASLKGYKEFFAPYLLIWEAMIRSKATGLKELDLEGIYDHRIPSTRTWTGFSHFKRGFRGEEVELIGSFVKTYNPLVKAVYRLGSISF